MTSKPSHGSTAHLPCGQEALKARYCHVPCHGCGVPRAPSAQKHRKVTPGHAPSIGLFAPAQPLRVMTGRKCGCYVRSSPAPRPTAAAPFTFLLPKGYSEKRQPISVLPLKADSAAKWVWGRAAHPVCRLEHLGAHGHV